jgi:MATE family multidrug resistance protein
VDAPLDSGLRAVLRLAWPTVLSFVLNNGYRINDQYWVQGLGGDAHAAIASSTVLLILNFAVIFVAVGGTSPLVSRAVGARDRAERDDVIRHALVLAVLIAALLGVVGWWGTPHAARAFDVAPSVEPLMVGYLRTIYLGMLALVIAPVVDNVYFAMGNTRVPMVLQGVAVSLNLALNPLLIYGAGSWDGLGIEGAALATCLSRGLTSAVGLLLLVRGYGIRLRGGRLRVERALAMVRLGLPVALSIAVYAGVYVALFALVISPLGRDTSAGFGIGFNVFESVSYPFFLGVAIAGSSLVGRNLGAGRPAEAWRAVRNARLLGRLVGVAFGLLFWLGGPTIAPWFTEEPGVLAETLLYVSILAWSQPLVAEEAVNEKVLFGAGHPRAIFWISTLGNVARVPLAWWLAFGLGGGAAGLWWAINLTTLFKAGGFLLEVRRGRWVEPIGVRTAA